MSNTRGRAPASPGLLRPSKSILRWAGTPGLLLLMLGLVAVLSGVHGVCAQKDPALHLYELISQARLYEGLAPLGRSTLLNQAAQRHADDLVALGKVTHEGSDGSSFQQRIREVRYHAWEDGLLVDEVIWAGLGTAEDALVWLHSNPSWKVLTDPRYREIGVGYADDNGVHYFVITVGSRPGVLPIFINDGAETTDTAQVALHLTNEEAVPFGEGNWMGRAIEVRISNQPDFEGLPWLPWEPLLPWVLAGDQPGEYAVYVEFRDGANRTAVSQDTIRLVTPQEMPPTPTPFFTLLKATPVALATLPPVTPTAVPGGTPPASPGPQEPTVTSTPPAGTSGGGSPLSTALPPYPTWTPLPDQSGVESTERSTDWPVVLAFLLQGAALLLGAALFLRQR